mmetsp:Transcript_5321/g.8924  ORF Transcript_5321/g.8924 Transcript_5321/m.8924 type:complete len:134 (+) Transcript_5321:967-1368(+)
MRSFFAQPPIKILKTSSSSLSSSSSSNLAGSTDGLSASAPISSTCSSASPDEVEMPSSFADAEQPSPYDDNDNDNSHDNTLVGGKISQCEDDSNNPLANADLNLNLGSLFNLEAPAPLSPPTMRFDLLCSNQR